MKNIENLAEEIRNRQLVVEYLKVAKKGYVCPNCGNGSGENGTGATVSKDGTRLLCGKCQRGFTNIDIIASYLGLDTTGMDFLEVVRFATERLGIVEDINGTKNEDRKVQAKVKSPEMSQMIISDVAQAQRNRIPVQERRGLKEETLKEFKIGLMGEWTPPIVRTEQGVNKKSYPTPRVIIPHLTIPELSGMQLTYCASLLMSERERLDRVGKSYVKYLYGGERTPFGLNTLRLDSEKVFITEGEWDALSIWQATGGKYPVVATGGTAENGTLNVLENFYVHHKPLIYFVGDNDSAGKKFAGELCNKLRQAGFSAMAIYFADLSAQKLDANKILMEEGETKLARKLNSAIEMVQAEISESEVAERKKLLGEDTAEYLSDEFKLYVEENKKYVGRQTGFKNIDEEMKIFKPGVYILGGLAALGKTTFALQLLEQMARRGENCIYCSYEMERGFLYAKMLAREVSRLESNNYKEEIRYPLTAVQITQGELGEHEENYDTAVKNFIESKIPLRIWELDEVKVEALIERLKKISETLEKPPIVCIDYLQLLVSGHENPKNALDEVLRKIFNFRRKTNTTFIIISSLNRMNYNTEISYESFKETGTIEYSADVVWGLQLLLQERTAASIEAAKKEIPRKIQLKCLKNRFGSNYDVGFLYYPNADVFLEMKEYSDYIGCRKSDGDQMEEAGKLRKKKMY